jgi:hypothetical protein
VKSWYNRVTRDPNDLSPVLDAIDYFDEQYLEARQEMAKLNGMNLIQVQTRLCGIVEYRYQQLSEIELIMKYLEIREEAVVGTQRRHYVEHYNRKLTDQMVNKFAESHPDVIALRELRNHVAAVRNKFMALSKGHECLHFQLSNITKLRVAGMDDAIL